MIPYGDFAEMGSDPNVFRPPSYEALTAALTDCVTCTCVRGKGMLRIPLMSLSC